MSESQAPTDAADDQRPRTALVTGGNRGIGRAICEQFADHGMDVVLGARDVDKGERAAAEIRGANGSIRVVRLDVADGDSVSSCARAIGPVDVLVNNAGVMLWTEDSFDPIQVEEEVLERTLAVNLHGARRVMRAFMPGMVERGFGRVVNVSSGAGSFETMPAGCGTAYCISKTALNSLSRLVAESVDPARVKVNSMCPGYVRTDMGLATGGEPTVRPEEAADTALWLATLEEEGPSGGFFRDRESIAW